jgi:hypothetical protein
MAAASSRKLMKIATSPRSRMRAKLRLTVSAGRATPVRCASAISAMVSLKECSARPSTRGR